MTSVPQATTHRSALTADASLTTDHSPLDTRHFLWKLWLAAFLARLIGVGLGMWLYPGWLVPPDTAGAYLPVARSLAAGHGYQTGPGAFNTTIPPLLPCWLALLMQATGPDLPVWLPGIFNAVFRAAGVVLVYLLGQRYFGHRVGLLGALVYLCDPWEAFWAGLVMKEPLAVPLFLLTVWLLSRLDDRRSVGLACAAGATAGLATLARFPCAGLLPAAFLVLMRPGSLPAGRRLASAGRALGLFACLAAAMLAVLSPWLVRNWMLVGQPILSEHFAGQYMYTGNGPGIQMEQDGYYMPKGIGEQAPGEAYAKPPWAKEAHLFSWTLEYLVTHPGEALKRLLSKVVNMWRPTFAGSSPRNLVLLAVPYCLEMALALAGLVIAGWRRLACPAVWIPLAFFVCVHLAFWGEIRNRQYLTPLLFVFAGLALDRLFFRRPAPEP